MRRCSRASLAVHAFLRFSSGLRSEITGRYERRKCSTALCFASCLLRWLSLTCRHAHSVPEINKPATQQLECVASRLHFIPSGISLKSACAWSDCRAIFTPIRNDHFESCPVFFFLSPPPPLVHWTRTGHLVTRLFLVFRLLRFVPLIRDVETSDCQVPARNFQCRKSCE